MIRIRDIKLPVAHTMDDVLRHVCRLLKIKEIEQYVIVKKSIDARDKENIRIVYTLDVEVEHEEKLLWRKNISVVHREAMEWKPCRKKSNVRPVVVGSGPAGLFCALALAEAGCCPIVLERGRDVDSRKRDVELFWQTGVLQPESNVQYGEGGAGTFSDGKLNTGVNDQRIGKILEVFVSAGAPEEILYEAKPHVGTDKLICVVKNLRRRICALGGEFRFETKWLDFDQENGQLTGITAASTGGVYTLPAEVLVLAVGHSARDTFERLHEKGIRMEAKPFSVGVRIEHNQRRINESQYGRFHTLLDPADYKMNVRLKDGRGVYTFCMCPGGVVVAAASEKGQVVTNGMSCYARDAQNANSALLVSVGPKDYGSEGPLAGIHFQRRLEKSAFLAGGGDYRAPAQLVGDFLRDQRTVAFGSVEPSYRPGVRGADLRECLDHFVIESLKEGITRMGGRLKGFDDAEAVLTGVESRSSSPVRILRNEHYDSSVKGIMPCGEGAGYAGGIMSAAVDGLKCAEKILGVE